MKKMSKFHIVCVISIVFLISCISAANRHNNERGPVSSRRLLVGGAMIHQRSMSDRQRSLSSEEYEKLSQKEEEAIRENDFTAKKISPQLTKIDQAPVTVATTTATATATAATTTTANSVMPNHDTDSNSQLVFVNLTKVINEANKNDSTRLVSSSLSLIKQDAQIACGETNRNGVPSGLPTQETLQNRIVGGTKAEPGEFPYQVRLNIRSRRGTSLCGGVIIDQRHILTAAHCLTTW